MMLTRFALLVCVFYLTLTFTLEMGILLLAHLRGIAGIHCSRIGWWLLFAAMWATSFALASRFSSFFTRR
jgi:hypothetical protein